MKTRKEKNLIIFNFQTNVVVREKTFEYLFDFELREEKAIENRTTAHFPFSFNFLLLISLFFINKHQTGVTMKIDNLVDCEK
jgi:hypothetical protein